MSDNTLRSLRLLIARGAAMCFVFGMLTMIIAGATTYYNLEYGYIGTGTIFWIFMIVFGFISFITYWLVRYTRRSYQLILLAIIAMPGSWFIGGSILLFGAIRARKKVKHLLDEMARVSPPKDWEQIVQKLKNMFDSGDIEGLIQVLETEKHQRTRTLAVVRLFQLADSKAIPAFTGALQDKSEDIRLWAALGLALFGKQDGLRIIEKGIQHKEPNMRRVVVQVLVNLDNPKVIGLLQKATTDSDTEVRELAQKALAQRQPPSTYRKGKEV